VVLIFAVLRHVARGRRLRGWHGAERGGRALPSSRTHRGGGGGGGRGRNAERAAHETGAVEAAAPRGVEVVEAVQVVEVGVARQVGQPREVCVLRHRRRRDVVQQRVLVVVSRNCVAGYQNCWQG
jgi:hypothetical protein